MEGKGRKGGRQRNFEFAVDVDIILDNLPPRQRTAWVEDAIRLRAGTPNEETQLRREAEALEAQERQLQERKRVVQAKLASYDEGRGGDVRRALAKYLRGDPGEEAQRRWATQHGLSWDAYKALRAEVQHRA